jgi:Transposase IS66 family
MCDDRPFGGLAPPAALYYASRDRRHEHPVCHLRDYNGILQADACSGYNGLYDQARPQGVITPALCWSHARRLFFEARRYRGQCAARKTAPTISPIALEAVRRIDALSISSAASTARASMSAWVCADNIARRSWSPWKAGWARSARDCRARPRSSIRSITCSGAGPASPASSTTVRLASRIMRPNVR